MSKRYLLDANPFIEAKNRHYGFDICPGFWSSLVAQHEAKRVFSIDRIEISCRSRMTRSRSGSRPCPDTFFKKTQDQAVIDKFQEMVQWVYVQPQFTDAAKTEFASVADGWVMAYAAVIGATVDDEQYAPDAKRKVPIPNVCIEFDIKYVDTFEMLRGPGREVRPPHQTRASPIVTTLERLNVRQSTSCEVVCYRHRRRT